MKISIRNFKAIRELNDYEIKPMNILSGANSTGKTSFIQLLLLIKQTLEYGRNDEYLLLNHPDFIELGNDENIINKRSINNSIEIKINFTNNELCDIFNLSEHERKEYFDANLVIKVEYVFKNKFYVKNMSIGFDDQEITYLKTDSKKISTYNAKYLVNNKVIKEKKGIKIFPNRFIPTLQQDSFILQNSFFSHLNDSHFLLPKYFEKIKYIGPLRGEPKPSYPENRPVKAVGKYGENFAIIYGKYSKNKITYSHIYTNNLVISTLAEALNYWMCDIFKTAKKIESKKSGSDVQRVYIVEVTNFFDEKISITHVGFGISQLLPIVIQGLLLEEGDIFILEQPEIHLHPKIQSLLFDFLYSLTLKGVRIIVETHSDHFINRMRRRIAEDPTNTLAEKMNLTFIEPNRKEGEFHQLHMDEYGTLDFWPDDFFDQYDEDTRAIVKAQAAKHRANLKQENPSPNPAA